MGTVLSVDGTTICFDAWGDGQPLIMIDGATGHRAVSQTHAQVGVLLRARALADLLPAASLRAVEGAQHNVAAEVLAAALRQFA